MNINEQIEILEAYRDGKRIERTFNDELWCVLEPAVKGADILFNFVQQRYRIVKTGEERLIDRLERVSKNYVSSNGSLLVVINDIKEGKYRDE